MDAITALGMVTTQQHMLISGSRDGVVKVWK
jgi:hypothetical protein